METRNVFLDATEFVSSSFNFNSDRLQSLREKANNGTVQVFTTDVVYRETINRIRVHADEAINEIRQLSKSSKLRTVRHLIKEQLDPIDSLDAEELAKRSIAEFDRYLEDIGATVLSSKDLPAGPTLDRYFNRKAPFGTGKKKAEFPDAFSLQAVWEWANENKEKVYVVSGDDGLEEGSKENKCLIIIKNLGEFLELVTEFEQKELEEFIHSFSSRFSTEIKTDVGQAFMEYAELTTDYDYSAEFSELKVERVHLDSVYVINADKDSLELDIEGTITFSAHVEHSDYDNGAYDKEDGVYVYLPRVSYRFTSETQQRGTLEYHIDRSPPHDWKDVSLSGASLNPDLIQLDIENLLYPDRYEH